jgi:hypothetical protein
VGTYHCQLEKTFRRRDYPFHPAVGQAQQATWGQQYAPIAAEWDINSMLLRLPERQIGRKVKLLAPPVIWQAKHTAFFKKAPITTAQRKSLDTEDANIYTFFAGHVAI